MTAAQTEPDWSFRRVPTIQQKEVMQKHKARFPNNEEKLQWWLRRLDINILCDYLVYIPYDKFVLDETPLGKGGFGIVHKAEIMEIGESGVSRTVVLKLFKNTSDSTIRNELCINVHLQYHHYHHDQTRKSLWAGALRVIGITENNNGKLAIIVQHAPGGNLEENLRDFPPQSWGRVWRIAVGITRRLQAMHEANMVHFDLHPGNIVFLDNTVDANLSIIDVGISKMVEDLPNGSRGIYGRTAYLPPEVWTNQANQKVYTKAFDIHCLGTLLWQLTSLTPPRESAGALPADVDVSSGLREVPVPGTPVVFETIYRKCWNPDPHKRPTIEEVLEELMRAESKMFESEYTPPHRRRDLVSSPSRFILQDELDRKDGSGRDLESIRNPSEPPEVLNDSSWYGVQFINGAARHTPYSQIMDVLLETLGEDTKVRSLLDKPNILYSSRGFAKAWKDASENLSGDGSQFIKAQIRLERCLDEIIDIENRFTSKSSSCLFTAKAVFSDVKKYRDNKLRDLTMLARLTKLVNMVLRMEKGLRLRDLYKLQEQLRPPSRANPFLLCCSLTPKPPKIVTAECVYAAYVEVLDHENQNDSRLRGSWNFENPPEELKGETGMCNWALGKDIHNYEELLDAWQQEVVNIARQVWDNLTRDDGERKIVTAIESLIKNIREKGPGFSKVRGITYPESLREVSV